MDPMTMMAGGALMGAAGNLIGGLTADTSVPSSEMISVSNDPMQNAYMGRYLYDAALPLGMSDPDEIPSPGRSLVNQINALPVENRLKRRAVIGLSAIFDNPDADPMDVLGNLQGASANEFYRAIVGGLGRIGYSFDDIPNLQSREVAHNEFVTGLRESRGDPLERISQRASIAENVNNMLYGASQFASGQGEMDPLSNAQLARLNRVTNEQEEQALLRSANLGMRPGDIAMQFAQQRQENPLTALGQTLGIAGAIQNLYTQQQAGLQNALGLAVPAQSNALNTAANQASMANQLQAAGRQQQASTQSNAIAGAFGNIASGLQGEANFRRSQELLDRRAPAAPLSNPSGVPAGSVTMPTGSTVPMQFTTPYTPGGR